MYRTFKTRRRFPLAKKWSNYRWEVKNSKDEWKIAGTPTSMVEVKNETCFTFNFGNVIIENIRIFHLGN